MDLEGSQRGLQTWGKDQGSAHCETRGVQRVVLCLLAPPWLAYADYARKGGWDEGLKEGEEVRLSN